jgi:diguanylate cyclase (GGDEF)-like protein
MNILLNDHTISINEVRETMASLELFRATGDDGGLAESVKTAELCEELPPIYEAIAMTALVSFMTGTDKRDDIYSLFLLSNYIAQSREMITDDTTGYLNKRGLMRWAQREYRPEDNSYGVFVVDLVKFKKVNDVLGHAIGDDALRLACDTISSQTRVSDNTVAHERRKRPTKDVLSVARIGGDEIVFVMDFNGLDSGTVQEVVGRVMEHLRAEKITMTSVDGLLQQAFGFRVGCAVSTPQNQLDFKQAIYIADQAQNATRTEEDR